MYFAKMVCICLVTIIIYISNIYSSDNFTFVDSNMG